MTRKKKSDQVDVVLLKATHNGRPGDVVSLPRDHAERLAERGHVRLAEDG